MICPFCGKKNPESAPKCLYCGVRLQSAPLIPEVFPPHRKRITPWIIVCASLGIFQIIVLLIVWMQK